MSNEGYLLGYDVGTSAIKASVISIETGRLVASAVSTETELEVIAQEPGWAEQHPDTWWDQAKIATDILRHKQNIDLTRVKAIGISYQMHGLVMVDSSHQPLAPSIIWSDSRAVAIGNRAFEELGEGYCLEHFLNSPGNFTASKLRWVKENKPEIYEKIHKIMLPGDFLALKLTGEIATTQSGLSEGIMWDYQEKGLAHSLLNYYGIDADLIPQVGSSFASLGTVRKEVAEEWGLTTGIPVAYRAGDQPNNAFSLRVINPGEVAATAGTSGVIYGVDQNPLYDPKSRVNTFVHVNYSAAEPRYGILLCVNGTGILNSWLRQTLSAGQTEVLKYEDMNTWAQSAPPGAQGLTILPYGNGAERTLENKDFCASIQGLNFNIHNRAHITRAAQESIVFALRYGFDIMRSMKVSVSAIRAGNANMFLSPLFTEVFATVCGTQVELFNTDGAQGAARGAGVGAGIFANIDDAFQGLKTVKTIEPNSQLSEIYAQVYDRWQTILKNQGLADNNAHSCLK